MTSLSNEKKKKKLVWIAGAKVQVTGYRYFTLPGFDQPEEIQFIDIEKKINRYG